MKVTDLLYVLPIPTKLGAMEMVLNHSLILDERNGPTLVDAGAGLEALEAALEEAGVRLSDLRRLILTHQDLDHVASAAAVVGASGAEVLAHATEAPYIDGTHRPIKFPPPEALAQFPAEVRAFFERGVEPVRVDRLLQDGEVLDLAGGLRVVFTPGHTPGHISLYLEKDRALIAGDAVGVDEAGRVQAPSERATPDMTEALRSIQKLAGLPLETLVAYHGGVARGDIRSQLRRVAEGQG